MNYRYIFKPKILASIVIALALIWNFLPAEQKQRFEMIGQDGTSKQRLLYWENGIEMIKDNPIIGVGYFNFAPYFERYYPEDVILGKSELPHNIFIQVGTDAGATGLIVFSAMLLVGFRLGRNLNRDQCRNSDNVIGRCFNISLLGFLVAGQFVTVTYYPYFWIHLALIVSLKNIEKRNYRKPSIKNRPKDLRV